MRNSVSRETRRCTENPIPLKKFHLLQLNDFHRDLLEVLHLTVDEKCVQLCSIKEEKYYSMRHQTFYPFH